MEHRKSIFLLIITSILWSFGGIIIKSITWNSYAIIGLRSLIALAVLIPFVQKLRIPQNVYSVLSILCYVGLICTCVAATKLTTAANAILLQYTAPIYSMLFGYWVMHEPIRRKDIIAIGFLFGGMVIFLFDGLAGGHLIGNLLALLSGVCYGLMGVFMRRDPSGNPAQNVVWGNLIAFLIMIPFMGQVEVTKTNLLLITIMGLVQLGIPYILYSIAIRHVTSLEITLITVLEPIMNPVWVLLIIGEVPGWFSVLGGIIVLGTVICHELSSSMNKN